MKLARCLILALMLLGCICGGFTWGAKTAGATSYHNGHVAGFEQGFANAINGNMATWAAVCFKSHEFKWRGKAMWCGPVKKT